MHGYDKLPPRADEYDFDRSPEANVMDTVVHLQLEVEVLKFVQSAPLALAMRTLPVPSKPVTFTSTKVPKFSGVTSDQYRQVFDAIVRSNGWDDATVALQLLSHLEGDALNVALLVPEVRRVTRAGLVGAITEHYGSPGHLADYRRQFERRKWKTRRSSPLLWKHLQLKHLSIWARMRDSGSYGTGSLPVMRTVLCDGISIVFHRRLPSGTLLTDVECGRATRYTLCDEPVCMSADRVVAAVTALPVEPGDLEVLLRRLLPTTPVPTPLPRPMPTDFARAPAVRKVGPDADTTTSDLDYGNGKPAAAPAPGNAGSSLAVATGSSSQRLDYDSVFIVWKSGPRGGQVPGIG